MSGSNIVPMPKPAMPAPMAYPWPMPPGGFPAGCCPPGGMDALLQCYCDIQAATAFISKVVQDLAANDPAFQQSLVDAIAASGSNIPLVGVTNGSNAQPGQVGEFIELVTPTSFPIGSNTQVVSAGTLPPGDWDCWLFLGPSEQLTLLSCSLAPLPAGFSGPLFSLGSDVGPDWLAITGNTIRASTTVPSLIAWSLVTQGATTAGTCNIWFQARRRR